MRYLTIFLIFAIFLFMMAGCGGKEQTQTPGTNPFFSITLAPQLEVNNVNTNTATSNPTLTNTANSSASSTPTLTNTNNPTTNNTNTANNTNTNTVTVPK
ncbi:MAG: hypothetical protein QXJ06_06055 [Candidatus Aenigmatarchaeota archaeon]